MKDKKGQEEIIAGFQSLRNEQRSVAAKINELQQDLNEHKIVIETLEGVDGDRKCFRMVGGVLVERTVKDVVPALVNNRDKLGKLVESLNTQLTDKGAEINGYMEKHQIQIRGQGQEGKKEEKDGDVKSGGVLVSQQSN
ncbi:prefoldin subunit 2 [Eurytemora carolleeae]|uniref:prefoldin subunit 2 n=1 Tax=Eurytemora carolleeae TaxID=1294199 RepID=UPI000C77CADF|nr:prefoldin subunit 2 [Eurytemora carolleeae]|eukprot:XP_023325258.1 prefoldin subunit 2-like [Eurytemora affinis]